MVNRHCYTAAEMDLVRRRYGELTAAELAARIHGTPRAARLIYRLAHRIGLRKWPDCREHYEPVRRLHAEGLTDADIASRLGLDRRYVSTIRADRLRLPVNADAVRAAGRRAVAAQRRTLGIRSSGDLRRWAYRKFARERGWPEDLRPRAVQILELLAVAGPLDRWQIAEGIGWNVGRSLKGKHGQRFLLASNDPEGSYTAHLLKRGLVVYQIRSRSSGRQGIGRLPGLYMLSPAALDIVIGRTRNESATQSHGDPRPGQSGVPVAG